VWKDARRESFFQREIERDSRETSGEQSRKRRRLSSRIDAPHFADYPRFLSLRNCLRKKNFSASLQIVYITHAAISIFIDVARFFFFFFFDTLFFPQLPKNGKRFWGKTVNRWRDFEWVLIWVGFEIVSL